MLGCFKVARSIVGHKRKVFLSESVSSQSSSGHANYRVKQISLLRMASAVRLYEAAASDAAEAGVGVFEVAVSGDGA